MPEPTPIGRNAPHVVVADQTPSPFDPWTEETALVMDIRGPRHAHHGTQSTTLELHRPLQPNEIPLLEAS